MQLNKGARTRWVYESTMTGSSSRVHELIMLGCDRYKEALQLPYHKHEQAYEFVYVERGKVVWEVDGTLHDTRAGELFHTRPDEWHRARMDYLEPCSIWWIILADPSASGSASWLGVRPEEQKAIAERLQALPRTFPSHPQVKNRFAQLQQTITEEQGLWLSLKVRHLVLDIILAILEPASSKRIPDDLHGAMLSIAETIRQAPEERQSVQELAAIIGVSESHFYRLFRETFGQSPASYMERSRIEHAGRILRGSDISITQLALDLGFRTSQHFSTAFKKFTGLTPSQWRKLLS